MDLPHSSASTTATQTQGSSDISDQVASLRTGLTVLLVAVLCLGLAVSLTLYRQVSIINGQLTESRRLVEDYNTNAFPRISAFVVSLNYYAKTNPDFRPILSRYKLTVDETPSGAAAPAGKK